MFGSVRSLTILNMLHQVHLHAAYPISLILYRLDLLNLSTIHSRHGNNLLPDFRVFDRLVMVIWDVANGLKQKQSEPLQSADTQNIKLFHILKNSQGQLLDCLSFFTSKI